MTSTPLLQKMQGQLLADLSHARAEVARIESLLEEVQQEISGVRASTSAPRVTEDPKIADGAPDLGPYSGLQPADAAVEYLKGFNKPISTGMICAELQRAGFEFTSGHPTRAMGEILRKRATRHGDVFIVSNGLWGFTKNFSPAKVARLRKRHGGMGGRSPDEHSDRTSRGIKRAQENGIRVGAKLKFTVEKATAFREALKRGVSIGDACDAAGITRATYYFYKKRGLMEWNQGDPWPPKQIEGDELEASERPALRVVRS